MSAHFSEARDPRRALWPLDSTLGAQRLWEGDANSASLLTLLLPVALGDPPSPPLSLSLSLPSLSLPLSLLCELVDWA